MTCLLVQYDSEPETDRRYSRYSGYSGYSGYLGYLGYSGIERLSDSWKQTSR
jgi:hypothetical protein